MSVSRSLRDIGALKCVPEHHGSVLRWRDVGVPASLDDAWIRDLQLNNKGRKLRTKSRRGVNVEVTSNIIRGPPDTTRAYLGKLGISLTGSANT